MCLFFGFLELLYHAIFSSIQLCFIKISSPTPSPSIFLDLWHDIFQFSPFDLLNFNILLVLKGVLQHKMIEKAGVKKIAWTWFILVTPIELYIIYENESCSAFDLSFLIHGCFVHYDHHSSLLLLINLK